MLKIRIIPTLLYKDVGLVKGVGFDSWRRVGTVLPAVKVYNRRDVDELVILDIVASSAGRAPDYVAVEQWASECFVPLTVGGGVSELEHIKQLLRAGADKVCINSAALARPDFINEAAQRFGCQCVVVSIDAKRVDGGNYCVFAQAGKVATTWDAVAWAKEVERRGAGEILLTAIARDGTQSGYDLELIEKVSQAVSIPVIASGGAANFEHFRAALLSGAAAVAAASMFHFTEQTPSEARDYLARHGFPVRRVS